MMERDGMYDVYDIDPTPSPLHTPPLRTSIARGVSMIQFGGRTDNIYSHILGSSLYIAKIDINFTALAELDEVVYDIHNQRTYLKPGMLPGVLDYTTEDVRIYIENYRGTTRASFCPHLFTMIKSITDSTVVILTNTRTAACNTHTHSYIRSTT